MALSAKLFKFECPASTGSQAYTGVGFQGKFGIFFATLKTADGTAVDYNIAIGFARASGANGQASVSGSGQDNAATSNVDRTNSNAACIRLREHTGTLKYEAAFTSWDADGFTLNWTTVTSGVDIYVLILGGSDITDVATGTLLVPASAGDLDTTGLAFNPSSGGDSVLVTLSTKAAADAFAGTLMWHGMGMARSSSEQWMMAVSSTNALATMDASRLQRTDMCAGVAFGSEGRGDLASFTSWLAAGFRLTYSGSLTVNDRVYWAVIKGVTGWCKLTTITQPAATGNQPLAGQPITPIAALFASTGATAGTVAQQHNRMAVGAATATNARGSVWSGDTDNVPDAISDQANDSTKALILYNEGTPDLKAAFDLVSFDANGLTVNWTTVADATARQILVALFGAAAAVTGSLGVSAPVWFG